MEFKIFHRSYKSQSIQVTKRVVHVSKLITDKYRVQRMKIHRKVFSFSLAVFVASAAMTSVQAATEQVKPPANLRLIKMRG